MVNFAHLDTIPVQYKDRDLYSWAPDVTLMRTNEEENEVLGKMLSQKINRSAAPVSVVLPLKGISQIDAAGGIFYHPEIDQVLFESIKKYVNEKINVIEVDAHINDVEFAETLVKTLLELMQTTKVGFIKNGRG